MRSGAADGDELLVEELLAGVSDDSSVRAPHARRLPEGRASFGGARPAQDSLRYIRSVSYVLNPRRS